MDSNQKGICTGKGIFRASFSATFIKFSSITVSFKTIWIHSEEPKLFGQWANVKFEKIAPSQKENHSGGTKSNKKAAKDVHPKVYYI